MASPEMVELPALAAARTELATGGYPAPEDCLFDLSPITSLFYVEQWCYTLLEQWISEAGNAEDEPMDAQEQIASVMDAIGTACGNLDAACATLGVLPPEATEK